MNLPRDASSEIDMIVQTFQSIGRLVCDLLFWIAQRFFWFLLSLGAILVLRAVILNGLE